MIRDELDIRQRLQEDEYGFPYHYIPTWSEESFSQVRHWSWGYRYLGGVQVVLDQIQSLSFRSLVDIGCGDGRFMMEAAGRFPDAELIGVDYSERAIGIARVMNPGLRFQTVNIIEEPLTARFDVATCIEVLEHIPPDLVDAFCRATAGSLDDGGWLVLTVPHTNKWVSAKHYQHFDSARLTSLLSPYFEDMRFIPFDPRTRYVMPVLERLMGGAGKNFLVTNSRLNSWFFDFYRKRYLYARSESQCWRIAVVCRRR